MVVGRQVERLDPPLGEEADGAEGGQQPEQDRGRRRSTRRTPGRHARRLPVAVDAARRRRPGDQVSRLSPSASQKPIVTSSWPTTSVAEDPLDLRGQLAALVDVAGLEGGDGGVELLPRAGVDRSSPSNGASAAATAAEPRAAARPGRRAGSGGRVALDRRARPSRWASSSSSLTSIASQSGPRRRRRPSRRTGRRRRTRWSTQPARRRPPRPRPRPRSRRTRTSGAPTGARRRRRQRGRGGSPRRPRLSAPTLVLTNSASGRPRRPPARRSRRRRRTSRPGPPTAVHDGARPDRLRPDPRGARRLDGGRACSTVGSVGSGAGSPHGRRRPSPPPPRTPRTRAPPPRRPRRPWRRVATARRRRTLRAPAGPRRRSRRRSPHSASRKATSAPRSSADAVRNASAAVSASPPCHRIASSNAAPARRGAGTAGR